MGQICEKRAPPTGGRAPARPTPTRKIEGKTAEEWKTVGNDLVKRGDHGDAYQAYTKGIKADPDHAMSFSNRAMCLEKLGRYEEALSDAQRCCQLRPDFTKAFIRAANLLIVQLKRPQEAMEVLSRAPSDPEIQKLMTKVKPEADKAQKARLSSMDNAEKLKEEGNALFKKGSFEKALDQYKKALKACKDPKGEVAVAIHNNMAGCYQQLSDFHSVVTEANFVLDVQPGNTKALARRMIALEPLEKYEAALADARAVLNVHPQDEKANKLQHRLSKLVRDSRRDSGA